MGTMTPLSTRSPYTADIVLPRSSNEAGTLRTDNDYNKSIFGEFHLLSQFLTRHINVSVKSNAISNFSSHVVPNPSSPPPPPFPIHSLCSSLRKCCILCSSRLSLAVSRSARVTELNLRIPCFSMTTHTKFNSFGDKFLNKLASRLFLSNIKPIRIRKVIVN